MISKALRIAAEDAADQMRKAGLEPLEPYHGIVAHWRCQCQTCGRTVRPKLNTIRSGHTGCRFCGAIAGGKANRIPEQIAIADMRAAGLEPLDPYVTSDLPWRCRCLTCGKVVDPRLGDIRNGTGCRHCGARGLDPEASALLYLITHPALGAHKIGITGASVRTDRLAYHHRLGWELYQLRIFSTGRQAYRVEQSALRRAFVETGLGPYLSKSEMRQGGWTETICADAISLTRLWSLVEDFADLPRTPDRRRWAEVACRLGQAPRAARPEALRG